MSGLRGRLKGVFSRSARDKTSSGDEKSAPLPPREDVELGASERSNCYALTAAVLASLLDPKNPAELQKMGGAIGIAMNLMVDVSKGLLPIAREPSQLNFGKNVLPKKASVSLWKLIIAAFLDKILLLLTGAALFSLGIGVYRDVRDGTRTHWIEGAAILAAVVIVVMVNALNDYQREIQFRKLNETAEDRLVSIIQEGKPERISIHSIAVGDVVLLEPGDIVPADGVYITGHNLKCDESGATGETDSISKGDASVDPNLDPFLLSGTRVIDGTGQMLVIAVGESSFHGRMMMALQEDPGPTPLQLKLALLANAIAKTGAAIALLMFLTLTIKYIVTLSLQDGGLPEAAAIVERMLQIIIETVTVVVVAVPEGLPMAVTLALAYATIRMLQDNNLVRVLAACETMGNATSICSDKTGTLTENRMTVVKGLIAGEEYRPGATEDTVMPGLSSSVLTILCEAVALNSTAFETTDPSRGGKTFIGSKTEAALLMLLQSLALDYESCRNEAIILDVFPFSSERKSMTTVVGDPADDAKVRVYCKGASEIILERCRSRLDRTGQVESISAEDLRGLRRKITEMAEESLRTIAICMREMSREEYLNRADEGPPLEMMTLIALVGIEDPLRAGVAEAVATCQRAGIFVRMVTGDNVVTAQSIARKCGILMRGGVVMEGPRFRQLDDAALEDVIPRLQVIARSSPLDKQILVRKLRAMGEIVAVTGDGTNDGPALKAANVGFAMGIAGTEVAKEASSIVLLDDNFASIVKAVSWGRCVNDSVRKFLQFQLTVNVSAVITAFVSAAFDSKSRSVLTAVQLLWVNLIMDTFAALALATDRPSPEILERHPESPAANLLSVKMLKLIISQALFQVAITLLMLHFGHEVFHLKEDAASDRILGTTIFNTFVFMQLFNEINSRILYDGLNPFKGILRNQVFLGIWFATVMIQVLLVTYGGRPFSTVPIPWHLWLVSLGIGALSLPIALIVRLLPDWPSRGDKQERIYMSRERLQWQAAIGDVRRSLAFFNAIRRARKPLSIHSSESLK